MAKDEHTLFPHLEDHPLFDDEVMYPGMARYQLILGFMDDGAFVPTEREVAVLLEYWYKEAKKTESSLETERFLDRESFLYLQHAYGRIGLIDRCLPHEMVNAVLKQLREPHRNSEEDESREKETAQEDQFIEPPF